MKKYILFLTLIIGTLNGMGGSPQLVRKQDRTPRRNTSASDLMVQANTISREDLFDTRMANLDAQMRIHFPGWEDVDESEVVIEITEPIEHTKDEKHETYTGWINQDGYKVRLTASRYLPKIKPSEEIKPYGMSFVRLSIEDNGNHTVYWCEYETSKLAQKLFSILHILYLDQKDKLPKDQPEERKLVVKQRKVRIKELKKEVGSLIDTVSQVKSAHHAFIYSIAPLET